MVLCMFLNFLDELRAAGIPASAQGCPSINAIGNFVVDNDVSASFALDANHGIATYTFTMNVATGVDGVPGLITYCVYPNQPPFGAPPSRKPE